ncbi:hypothetical protein [Lichenifustis flavocetrariae]|uniref:Uncharacterized protein n=1 Tax=Lichenifustis flavocetrariae TaxID=2949735 RepID=A0AA41YUF7_9HYPH|nr:hypothetical protein [Lichenifustis flavocetrariae]MCW6507078.1 hypothetical protein [Lichenifustis flavocetrariae]
MTVTKPPVQAVPEDEFQKMWDADDRERLLTAYGLLWLVHGDFHADTNAKLASEARRRLMTLFPYDDRERAIALGKARAIRMGIDVQAWMGKAGQ